MLIKPAPEKKTLKLISFLIKTGVKPLEIAINETIAYTRERKIFGKSILDNQVVHYKLAELQTEIEALRSLLYRATGK